MEELKERVKKETRDFQDGISRVAEQQFTFFEVGHEYCLALFEMTGRNRKAAAKIAEIDPRTFQKYLDGASTKGTVTTRSVQKSRPK